MKYFLLNTATDNQVFYAYLYSTNSCRNSSLSAFLSSLSIDVNTNLQFIYIHIRQEKSEYDM